MSEPTRREVLLAQYAELMNRFGPHSERADSFLFAHAADARLIELCVLSRVLKIALDRERKDGEP